MNPTSLFTNLMSLVPRRDAEGRHPQGPDEGPRFELPELPEASRRGPAELSRLGERDDLEHDRDDRDDEADPRAELVNQRGADTLTAVDLEDEAPRSLDDSGFDGNGRPRTMKGQGEADLSGRADAPTGKRDLVAGPTENVAETATRTSASTPTQVDTQKGQPQPGQAQTTTSPTAPAQAVQTHAGQSQAGQGSTAQGAPPVQQPQAQTLQTQALQTAQVAALAPAANQVASAVQAQIPLSSQDPDASLEVPGGLDTAASEVSAPTGLDALLEAGLDDLGLKLTDRVLGVASSHSLSAGATQTSSDLSGEVADAVQRLLADAADESSLLRFRTESGQTFLAQARIEPGQPMELRLLADDPGVRAMLAERLSDLRSALGRVGFGDAEVQVDRDPSHRGDHSRPSDDREATVDELAPRTRRPSYGTPETAHGGAGRLHLIL